MSKRMSKRHELGNKIRQKLEKGDVSIGTWQQISHPSISEILGQADYEWVVVDLEHGSISMDRLPDLFRAIELGGTLPLARIAESKAKDCKQALDAGAGGIIAPMIISAEQLETVRNSCCWPPAGNRGVGYSRANLFGKHFEKYKEEAQTPLFVAQIEHINAVENMEKILKVDGLDAVIIGPYDLSASMGLTAEIKHNEFTAVMDYILKCCKQFNVPCGDHVVELNPKLLQKRIDQGYKFIAYGTDGVFLNHSSRFPL